jgi:hypothetical protein
MDMLFVLPTQYLEVLAGKQREWNYISILACFETTKNSSLPRGKCKLIARALFYIHCIDLVKYKFMIWYQMDVSYAYHGYLSFCIYLCISICVVMS